MNTRIKALRKYLKLNQTKFGEKIGLKQRTIADIERGRNSLTQRNFDNICRVFDVNPDWLKTGKGEMFNKKGRDRYLELLIAEYGLTSEHKILLESILELPPEMWQGVLNWIKNCAERLNIQTSAQLKENRRRELEKQIHDAQEELAKLNCVFDKPDSELSREEAHKLLDEELDAVEKSRAKSSVSTFSNGLTVYKSSEGVRV